MAKFLLAEDGDSMRHFLSRTLERAGHEVFFVSQGDEALPVLAEGRFDLLLADIVMPEMDGIEWAVEPWRWIRLSVSCSSPDLQPLPCATGEAPAQMPRSSQNHSICVVWLTKSTRPWTLSTGRLVLPLNSQTF